VDVYGTKQRACVMQLIFVDALAQDADVFPDGPTIGQFVLDITM